MGKKIRGNKIKLSPSVFRSKLYWVILNEYFIGYAHARWILAVYKYVNVDCLETRKLYNFGNMFTVFVYNSHVKTISLNSSIIAQFIDIRARDSGQVRF